MVDDSASLGVLAFVEAGECIRISSPRSSERKVEIGLAILLAAVVDVPWSHKTSHLGKARMGGVYGPDSFWVCNDYFIRSYPNDGTVFFM